MKECNRNNILAYHYRELSGKESVKIGEHITSCKDCASYIEDLRCLERKLNVWEDEKPAPVVLDNILNSIKPEASALAVPKLVVTFKPFLCMAGAILTIIALVCILKDNIALLPYWESIKATAFVEFIGPLGVASAIVFFIGLFMSFTIAPVLILETRGEGNFVT